MMESRWRFFVSEPVRSSSFARIGTPRTLSFSRNFRQRQLACNRAGPPTIPPSPLCLPMIVGRMIFFMFPLLAACHGALPSMLPCSPDSPGSPAVQGSSSAHPAVPLSSISPRCTSGKFPAMAANHASSRLAMRATPLRMSILTAAWFPATFVLILTSGNFPLRLLQRKMSNVQFASLTRRLKCKLPA